MVICLIPLCSMVPVTEHEYAIMKMLGMVSYWTFFHENLSEFTSGVFLATVKVGSIYVDFSSYNYDTQMMMISKLFTFKYFYIFEKTLTGLDGFSSAQQQKPVKIHLE